MATSPSATGSSSTSSSRISAASGAQPGRAGGSRPRSAVSSTPPERDPRGVVLLDSHNQIEFASPAARRLLGEFFPDGRGAAPSTALADWLESGSKRPLTCRRGDRHVTVERVGDSLLLEESNDVAGLTAREREILAWVARGKTNPEIARVLWVAPSTVRKHLENVYAKLGVSTRTAAVARFLGTIDAAGAEGDAAASGQT